MKPSWVQSARRIASLLVWFHSCALVDCAIMSQREVVVRHTKTVRNYSWKPTNGDGNSFIQSDAALPCRTGQQMLYTSPQEAKPLINSLLVPFHALAWAGKRNYVRQHASFGRSLF